MESRHLTPALTLMLMCPPLAAEAQEAHRPAVTVVTFQAARGAKLEDDQCVALADELAAALAGSGQFRVMPQQWLPGGDKPRRPLKEVRVAARGAGLDFIVTALVEPRGRSMTRPLPTAGLLPGRASLAIGLMTLLFHHDAPPESVALTVRALDVSTGTVVTTHQVIDRVGASPGAILSSMLPAPAHLVMAAATAGEESPVVKLLHAQIAAIAQRLAHDASLSASR